MARESVKVARYKYSRNISPLEDSMWRLDQKPENIYVAASLNNHSEALRFALQLQDAGFKVTSRWLRNDFSKKPAESNWREYAAYEETWGERDLEDLAAADTLIILANIPSSSGGYHAELGYFLGAKRTNIIAVGGKPNVFFYQKDVRSIVSTLCLVDWLQDPIHGDNYSIAGDILTIGDDSND